jgi:hypothetical protein
MLESGFYGNQDETYFVSLGGEIWCIQSPDLWAGDGEPVQVDALPADAVSIPDSWCYDLQIEDIK